MCVQSTIVEGTDIMQVQPKIGLLPIAYIVVHTAMKVYTYTY